jgi:hypothetical protein
MGNVTSIRFELHAREFASIDAASGVIRGVSVIAVGVAKGHGVQIDQTTLEQVKTCAEEYTNGLKVKMSHAGDAGDIVGFLSAFRIEGGKLLADLTLLKASRFRDYVLELAATIPDTFGLSIAFSGPTEAKGEMRFARCTEIYSADLVSEPAANPTGLFEAKPAANAGDNPAHKNNKIITKMEDEKQDPIAAMSAAIEALSARLSKLETPAAPADEKTDDAAMAAKLETVAELAAVNALKKFAATLGTPPAKPSNEGSAPADANAKTFEQLVKEHSKYSSDKALAIRETVAAHRKEHTAYLSRVQAGEVTLF